MYNFHIMDDFDNDEESHDVVWYRWSSLVRHDDIGRYDYRILMTGNYLFDCYNAIPEGFPMLHFDDVVKMKWLIGRYSVNSRDTHGRTLLHFAVEDGRIKPFEYLITLKDIELGCYNSLGETPLTLACRHRDSFFAKGLIQRGADVNQCTVDGHTPLDIAIENCRETAVLLLENGADVNCMSSGAFVPLKIACMKNDYDTIYMLLYYGAVVSMVQHSFLIEYMEKAPPDCQETLLFHYLEGIDKVDLDFISIIIERKFELFPVILERIRAVDCDSGHLKSDICNVEQLVALLQKFPSFREYFFEKFHVAGASFEQRASLETFSKFIFKLAEESLLLSDYLESKTASVQRIVEGYREFNMCKGELTELILLLISHGLPVYFEDFLAVHSYFGNGFLVKLFLHITMDQLYGTIDFRPSTGLLSVNQELMGVLIYKPNFDFNCDIAKSPPKFLNRFKLEFLNPISAFRYFASANFRKFVSEKYSYRQVVALLEQRQFPSLKELSRNVCQRFIYSKWEISDQKPGMYYDIVKRLPIHNYCKQILTFDVELYSV